MENVTSPLFGVNLIAFESMFMSDCFISCASIKRAKDISDGITKEMFFASARGEIMIEISFTMSDRSVIFGW